MLMKPSWKFTLLYWPLHLLLLFYDTSNIFVNLFLAADIFLLPRFLATNPSVFILLVISPSAGINAPFPGDNIQHDDYQEQNEQYQHHILLPESKFNY
jgi:hypothetical protein